jgi:hypothetical protein
VRASYTAIIAEARAAIARDAEPAWDALRERIVAAGGDERERQRALQQLERLNAVHRARTRVARTSAPTPPPPRRRVAFRTRPTITGNMDVRRSGTGDALTLAWDRAAGVASWEVRVSRRPDARRDYTVEETRTLPPNETSAEIALDELPVRVHVLGRAHDGRLLRRAILSGLTRHNRDDRWQRRASAS